MAYIDELLGSGEQIRYIARQHIFVLIGRVLMELLLMALLIAAGVVSSQAFNAEPLVAGMPVGQVILLVCAVLSVFVLGSALIDALRWTTEQYVITDRRVIQTEGVVNKMVIDSSLEKINDVELQQDLLGRIFDYGDLEVLTASESGINRMPRIASPLRFKRAMLEAKHEYERGYSYLDAQAVEPYTQSGSHAESGIRQMIEDLAALRDRGLLTPEEFESKKRELLSRI